MSAPTPLPVIAVVGITGDIGGGAAQALLHDGRFAVRAVASTHEAGSAAALALQAQGAELVRTEIDDAAALRQALEGADGLFAVTDQCTHLSPERELAEALGLAHAACRAAIGHVVWVTREDTRRWVPLDDPHPPTIAGRWKVPHYDAKGAANAFFRERGVPTTLLHGSFCWDDLLHRGLAPQRVASGRLIFSWPMGERPLPSIAAADIGACAPALFAAPHRWLGKSVHVAAAHLSGAQMASALSRALGEPVEHCCPSLATFAGRAYPGAAALANMFQFEHEFGQELAALRSVAGTRELNPHLLDIDAWLARHAHHFSVVRRGDGYEAGLIS